MYCFRLITLLAVSVEIIVWALHWGTCFWNIDISITFHSDVWRLLLWRRCGVVLCLVRSRTGAILTILIHIDIIITFVRAINAIVVTRDGIAAAFMNTLRKRTSLVWVPIITTSFPWTSVQTIVFYNSRSTYGDVSSLFIYDVSTTAPGYPWCSDDNDDAKIETLRVSAKIWGPKGWRTERNMWLFWAVVNKASCKCHWELLSMGAVRVTGLTGQISEQRSSKVRKHPSLRGERGSYDSVLLYAFIKIHVVNACDEDCRLLLRTTPDNCK